jgi:FkbM family methyltransferase
MLKKIARAPLRFATIRSRVAFWLNQEHYRELAIQAPLSHGLACPIYSPEYWCSFSEIFINAEYASAFDLIPLPKRWIDLGCHAGFFSLYVEWLRRKRGETGKSEALLVDADQRLEPAIEHLNQANGLSFRFLHGGVGAELGIMRFTERAFMASSASEIDNHDGRISLIPALTGEAIENVLPGPYDLIKVDIEGSEHDLLKRYHLLLSQCRHLLLEWHSWHAGGGGKAQLLELARSLGFELRAEVQPDHEVAQGKHCGVLLLEQAAAVPRGLAV